MTALHRPVVGSAEERDYLDAEDPAPYRAALHRPDVGSAEERDDLDAGDPAPYEAALHRSVVESAEERDYLTIKINGYLNFFYITVETNP